MRAVSLCVAVAAASLLAQRTPDFDPTAWLIWGRQIADGELHTLGGPSWKPFPVVFTTAFAPAGDTAAPWLWLIVARAGGLLALVTAFRLAERLAGRTAGWLAAAALALQTDFLFNAARGDSEGLLVALVLWAVLLQLDGRGLPALLAGAAAGLIRPELWPLLAVHGTWLVWRERSWRTAAVVGGAGLVVAAAWFVPERIGSGDWLRAATRAQNPVDGSPGQSAIPFLYVFLNSAIAVALPVYAGAAWAVVTAWRTPRHERSVRDRGVLWLFAGASAYMVLVGLGAEAGFTGNLRYVTVPAALLCVLAGVGLPPPAARAARLHPAPRAVLAVLAGASVAFSAALLVRNAFQLATEGRVYGRQLPEVIEAVGGEAVVKACGPLGASHFERQMVAYLLHARQEDVSTAITLDRGVAFARDGTGGAEETPMPVRLRMGDWVVRSSCDLPAG